MRKYTVLLIIFLLLAGCGPNNAPDNTAFPEVVDTSGIETSTQETAVAPADGQSYEGNITAYGELTPAIKTVLEYIAKEPGPSYGVVAYQQTEFEGGTLVLAEGLHDGENHPELYFVDKENIIRGFTTGSYCWELNFTEFLGKRIYYGRTYSEIPAKEVVFEYNGASESIAPHSREVIAVKNASKETAGLIENVQGYILITDNKDMPASFEIKKDDGKIVNYIEETLQGMPIPPYEDVEDPSIRYASLYQYNLMTAPEDVSATEKIGRVSLQSGESEQQLEFAGYFKDILPQELFKSISVYALCSNFLYDSQYLPTGGTARLASDKGFPKDAEIWCYFSRLTKDTWTLYKKSGSVDFLRTIRKPDAQGNIELLDSAGYYLIAVCIDTPDVNTGTMVYTGVIGLG